MANDFYQDSGNPATGSSGSSALVRAEFAAIEVGFDKLPTLTGNGSKAVAVNAGGTALEAVSTITGLSIGGNAATATKSGLPVTDKSADYTCVIGDANTMIRHPSTDASNRTFTIPANASVAYDVGTALVFENEATANTVSVAITSDTLELSGVGTTGTRTIAAYGRAVAVKVASTKWRISGVGLS